ncbi:MAG: NAD-dependent epimerase/dehydratase family protein [Alphaproteobacteria bacterium]|jgi:UDP-glucose 4-epimerase|nr:NAD-dependent epimerase/dehydratase family protein [Alphaproteobacteria bacterium]
MARADLQAVRPPRRRYLVTGGAGFIGSHLVDRLVADGHHVRVLDDLSTGRRDNLPRGPELVVGDVSDPEVVAVAVDGCDGVFHLAAVASVERSRDDWLGTHRVNQSGTIAVFDAVRHAVSSGRSVPVVYASSAAVYGESGALPLVETAPTAPTSAYGADKAGSELHARVAWTAHRVPSIGFRFFNVYGPRQDGRSPYSGVISIFAERIVRGEPVVLFGDGRQTRDFVYVSDVVAGLVAGMMTAGPGARVYNLCSGRGTSILGLLETLETVCGRQAVRRHEPRRVGDIERSVGDPRRYQERFGLIPEVALAAGLRQTIDGRAGTALAAS